MKPTKEQFEEIDRYVETDVEAVQRAVAKQPKKEIPYGWNKNMADAPADVPLLVKSGSFKGRIYRATLKRNRIGALVRGESDSLWIKDDKEQFSRDSITEWYYPKNILRYREEIHNAYSNDNRPHITCEGSCPDGIQRAMLSDGTVLEM